VTRGLAASAAPLSRVLAAVKVSEVEAFHRLLLASRRIFVTGLGRTGLMARGFAMRLMHLGRRVYHVGDVITPAIRRGDLLVLCSRTGRSPVLLYYIAIARRAGARVALVTGERKSIVARRSDVVVCIPSENGAGKARGRGGGKGRGTLPLGSLFEQALLLVLDDVIVRLMGSLGLTEADLRRIHTTFE
jgi:6-phospho-3-hexuloisomerase